MTHPTLGVLACAALLSLSFGCSSTTDTAPSDAAAPGTDTSRNDTAVTPDVPSRDAPSTDVPSTDVPSTDVMSRDVPSTDVPSGDVPSDASMSDAVADAARDVPAASDACVRPDIMRLTGMVDCGSRSDGAVCPTGYQCLSFSGVVLQQYCGRSCMGDCDCPAGERCGSYTDKAGRHPLCVGL